MKSYHLQEDAIVWDWRSYHSIKIREFSYTQFETGFPIAVERAQGQSQDGLSIHVENWPNPNHLTRGRARPPSMKTVPRSIPPLLPYSYSLSSPPIFCRGLVRCP